MTRGVRPATFSTGVPALMAMARASVFMAAASALPRRMSEAFAKIKTAQEIARAMRHALKLRRGDGVHLLRRDEQRREPVSGGGDRCGEHFRPPERAGRFDGARLIRNLTAGEPAEFKAVGREAGGARHQLIADGLCHLRRNIEAAVIAHHRVDQQEGNVDALEELRHLLHLGAVMRNSRSARHRAHQARPAPRGRPACAPCRQLACESPRAGHGPGGWKA